MTRLMPDTQAPALTLPLVGGGTFDLSQSKAGSATMVVFYRGLHCPICADYLGKLNGMAAAFAEAGMPVVAVSMDPEERATKAKADWGLDNVPVAYGLDEATARAWGLWLTDAIAEKEIPFFCEPGTFWVRPDGRLYLIDVATMPFARPDLDLLLARVGAIAKGYPARGTRV